MIQYTPDGELCQTLRISVDFLREEIRGRFEAAVIILSFKILLRNFYQTKIGTLRCHVVKAEPRQHGANEHGISYLSLRP